MLRSVLSWMHWSQRRRARQEELLLQQEARLRQFLWEVLLPQLLMEQRQQLWEMALPLADSLTRLDKRILASQMQQLEQASQQESLLMEVLDSLQPTAKVQLMSRVGQPTRQLPSSSSAN
jgi:hypothetical protein